MAQRYTTVGGVNLRQEPSWKTYINNYQGPIAYSGQPFVYKGKTRIVPRGALYLPEYDNEPATLVLARNGEAIDINSIPMADSDQTSNKAKKGLSSATKMLNRAQKPGYQEEKRPSGLKLATDGVFGGVKALGAGLLGTLATGSTLPLLAGGLYGAKKVIGGALGGLGGIMKGIGNVTGITPGIGKAMGGLKSMVGMGGPTKAERAGPLTNGQFINFEAKLFGYIDKEIDRDKRRLERMKRQSEYDEEAADESRGGALPGTPVRDGGSEKKPMSGLMKGLMVLGGIVALVGVITAIVAYKDELFKIWDEFGTALKVGAGIIAGLGIAGAASRLLDGLGGGGGGPPAGKSVRRDFTVNKKGEFLGRDGKQLSGQALEKAKAIHALDQADINKGTKFTKAGGAVRKFLAPFDKFLGKLGIGVAVVLSAATLYDAYEDYEEEIEQAEGDKNKEKAAEEKLGTVVFREVGMLAGAAGGAALGSAIPIPILGTIIGGVVGADVGVEIGQAAAQSYFKGDDFLDTLGGLLKEKYKANLDDRETISQDIAAEAQRLRARRAAAGEANRAPPAPVDYKANLDDQETISQHFAAKRQKRQESRAGGIPELTPPPPPDSATIDANVSAAADEAVITLPVKVLEGPPIVMPSPETGQGSAPGEIQTRPNDSTLNSASSNLNASRQMAYT